MSNHTPGPWINDSVVNFDFNYRTTYRPPNADNLPTAWFTRPPGYGGIRVVFSAAEKETTMRADVALIAAAPELLAAARASIDLLEDLSPAFSFKIESLLTAAIAKATGEASKMSKEGTPDSWPGSNPPS